MALQSPETRMRRSFVSLLAAGIILVSGSAAGAQCIEADSPGAMVEGDLTQRMFTDAAGRPEPAFILTLAAPACLTGSEETDNVKDTRTIHVFSTDASMMQRIQRFVDSMVLVRGTAFGALTVHHHAPIVMDAREINSAKAQMPACGSGRYRAVLRQSQPRLLEGERADGTRTHRDVACIQ